MSAMGRIGTILVLAAALASPAAFAGGGHIYIGGGDRHLQYGISIPLDGYGYYYGPRHYGYPYYRHYGYPDHRYYGRRYYDHGYYGERRHYPGPGSHKYCYRDRGHTRCYRYLHR